MDRWLSMSSNNHQSIKPAIIQVSPGTDIIEAIVQFALCRRSGLVIVSCSGEVSLATLYFPLAPSPYSISFGPLAILNLTGTFIYPPPPCAIPLPLPPPPTHTYGITVVTRQEEVFGGVIGGKVIAGGDGVTVMTMLFNNPEFSRVDDGIVIDEKTDDDTDSDEE